MENAKDTISVHATYTNESQTLDFSSPGDSPTLKSTRLDGTYHCGHMAAATLAYNYNTGFNKVYDDSAWTAQVSYLRWQNTKFILQYVSYTKLAGSTAAVSDNNTTLLQGWFVCLVVFDCFNNDDYQKVLAASLVSSAFSDKFSFQRADAATD